MKNWKTRNRILLALALPVIGMTLLVGMVTLERYRLSVGMDRLGALAELAPGLSAVVHELQKERGLSSGYIGSQGKDFSSALQDQRDVTDQAVRALENMLDRFDTTVYGADLDLRVRAVLEQLEVLAVMRQKVDTVSLDAGSMAQWYAASIARHLAVVEGMSILASDADMTRAIAAYAAFIAAKELAGQERAQGAPGIAAGGFAPTEHRHFIDLVEGQKRLFATFSAFATPSQAKALAEMMQQAPAMQIEAMRRIVVDSGYTGALTGITTADWLQTITSKIDMLKQLEDAMASDLRLRAESTGAAASRDFFVMLGLAVVLLAATTVLTGVVVRGITGPLGRLTQTMASLADGDTSVEIQGAERRDELGEMARSVQVFKEHALERMVMERQRKADAARLEQEKRATLHKLASDFEGNVGAIVQTVSSAASELEATAQSMASIAEETNCQAGAVASASSQASANVQTVAGAAEQLSASIDEIGRQVRVSSTVASRAADKARTTHTVIQSLSAQAGKISEVVELINSIAAQTNLLALNATIEAARAGDAGRGFAVVANEVKALATQTARATEDISGQITSVQAETNAAVAAMEEIAGIVGEVNEVTEIIAQAVAEQNAATREIARNVREASVGTNEVSTNIGGVTRAAQETGTASDQVVTASRELADNANRLSSEMDRFLTHVRAS